MSAPHIKDLETTDRKGLFACEAVGCGVSLRGQSYWVIVCNGKNVWLCVPCYRKQKNKP